MWYSIYSGKLLISITNNTTNHYSSDLIQFIKSLSKYSDTINQSAKYADNNLTYMLILGKTILFCFFNCQNLFKLANKGLI